MARTLSLLLIVALAAATFAQDLDSPRTGAPSNDPRQSAFESLVGRLKSTESALFENLISATWIEYAMVSSMGMGWTPMEGESSEDRAAYESLSASEKAAFKQLVEDSHNRIVAAGLN